VRANEQLFRSIFDNAQIGSVSSASMVEWLFQPRLSRDVGLHRGGAGGCREQFPVIADATFHKARVVDRDRSMPSAVAPRSGPIAAGLCHHSVHSNAVILTWSFYDGSILFNGTAPITGATGRYNVSIFSYYHSFSFFGRSANVTGSLPYAVGNFQGTVMGAGTQLYRSGLVDSAFRLSVNLKGGPAMPVQKFVKWQQKILLGVSLKVVAPTGQYDPTKLINWGANRWAFKPEFGYSERWGHWVLDGYSGVWFFTKNPEFFSHNAFFPGTQSQSQKPIGAFEGHLSYDVKPHLWFSLDGNYWFGGKTSLNGGRKFVDSREELTHRRDGLNPVSKHSL